MGIEPTYPAWKAGVATSWSQTRRSSQAEPHPDGVVLYHFLLPLRDTRHIIYECQLNVNNFFHFFYFSEKIILNAKGSESLRTHYFFT